MNDYETKQALRKDRLEQAAVRTQRESEALDARARAILDATAGTPILVGHYSERRHRRDLARADRSMRGAVDASRRAADLARRADAVGTAGISSDDPDAVVKLRAELEAYEAAQARDKQINVVFRKGGWPALVAAGLVEAESIEQLSALMADPALMAESSWEKAPIPRYRFSNRGANIRRIKARIAALETRDATPARDPIEGDGWRLVENRDVNRVQIFFTSKPPVEVRKALHSAGFHWAPSEEAWQRQASNGAWYAAQRALGPIA